MASRSKKPVEGTLLRIHYDAGWGNRITLRGNKPPLAWSVGEPATWSNGHVWTYVWPRDSGSRTPSILGRRRR